MMARLVPTPEARGEETGGVAEGSIAEQEACKHTDLVRHWF